MDFIIIIVLALAAYKGFQKGLIVAVFSFLATIIGLAAAVKLSAIVADWLGTQITMAKQWYPIISFALVFIAVVFLVRLLANFIEKTVKFAMLGWVNKLGGMVFFILLYATILSVVLFYGFKSGLIGAKNESSLQLYPYIKPLGPWFIQSIGVILPFFKDVFSDLTNFFDQVAQFNKATK